MLAQCFSNCPVWFHRRPRSLTIWSSPLSHHLIITSVSPSFTLKSFLILLVNVHIWNVNFVEVPIIIIIILYFENVSFFHTKLGLDVWITQDRQRNLWRHFTRFNSFTSGKIAFMKMPVFHPWVLEQVFSDGMPFHTNQFGLGKRHWNLETSSAVVEFQPPYHWCSVHFIS